MNFQYFLLEDNFLKNYFKKNISLLDAEEEQEKFYSKLKKLIEYIPVTKNTIKKKDYFLKNI